MNDIAQIAKLFGRRFNVDVRTAAVEILRGGDVVGRLRAMAQGKPREQPEDKPPVRGIIADVHQSAVAAVSYASTISSVDRPALIDKCKALLGSSPNWSQLPLPDGFKIQSSGHDESQIVRMFYNILLSRLLALADEKINSESVSLSRPPVRNQGLAAMAKAYSILTGKSIREATLDLAVKADEQGETK